MRIATIFVALGAMLVAAGWPPADTVRAVGACEMASGDQPRVDADNTGKNVRDRDGRTRTPMDQGNSDADRDITARIRKDIVANDALSMNAHNVKIITTEGVVTLRGPVRSTEEKAAVAAAAKRAPGVKRVDNQLEIERHH